MKKIIVPCLQVLLILGFVAPEILNYLFASVFLLIGIALIVMLVGASIYNILSLLASPFKTKQGK